MANFNSDVHGGKVNTCAPASREARKRELVHVWNTEKLQRLPEFLQGLSEDDASLLLEGFQEQLEKEIGV
jgi:hypothetical protein